MKINFKQKKVSVILVLMVLLCLIAVIGCSQSTDNNTAEPSSPKDNVKQEAKKRIVIGTAGVEGAWYILGGAWGQMMTNYVPNMEGTAEPSGASLENIRKLGTGEMNLGFSLSDTAYEAWKGIETYEGKAFPKLRGFLSSFPSILHIVTTENSGINSLKDIKGKRVAVGPAGSSTALISEKLFSLYGITFDDIKPLYLSFNEILTGLQDDSVDIGLWMTVTPNGAMLSFATEHNAKLIPIDDDTNKKLSEKYPAHYKAVIPGGLYPGIEDEVNSTAIMGVVYGTSEGFTETEAYELTKAIWDHRDEWVNAHSIAKGITLETAIEGQSLPLHVGAYKYYKEKGLDIPEALKPPELK